MFKLKTNLLPVIGLFVMVAVSIVAYIQESVFFDKILVCNFILLMVFFAKTQGEKTIRRTKINKIE